MLPPTKLRSCLLYMIVERTTYVHRYPTTTRGRRRRRRLSGVGVRSPCADAHRIVVMSVPRSVGRSDGCRLISAVDMPAISMPLHGNESLVVVPIQIQSHSHVLISHNNRQQCSLIFHQCTISYCIRYRTVSSRRLRSSRRGASPSNNGACEPRWIEFMASPVTWTSGRHSPEG